MPTFLQSLGWCSAAYSSWSYHWKTPHGSENWCASLKWSPVATGCCQKKLLVLRLLPFSIAENPPCKDMAVFLSQLQPSCSVGFLQTLMLSQQRVSVSCTSLWLHPASAGVSESVQSLHTFGTTRSSIWRVQVGLNRLSGFQISNWLLAKFTSASNFYSIFTVSIIFFWLKPAEGRQVSQMHETVRDNQWGWNNFFCVIETDSNNQIKLILTEN